MTDDDFDRFVVSYEVSHALASVAIRFLRRIAPNAYDDIPAVRDFRREFSELHARFVVPRRDLPVDLTAVQTIPNLKVVR